ncbi:TPA: hypothetical protein ACSBU7_002947, partial [Clostridioides difficile]
YSFLYSLEKINNERSTEKIKHPNIPLELSLKALKFKKALFKSVSKRKGCFDLLYMEKLKIYS